jgi:hypothetical protein
MPLLKDVKPTSFGISDMYVWKRPRKLTTRPTYTVFIIHGRGKMNGEEIKVMSE